MTFMGRLLGLLKADIHGVLDNIENKGLLLSHYCREMEGSLQEKTAQLNELVECTHSMKAEIAAREEEIEKLGNDLRLALGRDKESIARLLIRKQLVHRNYRDRMRQRYDALLEEKNQLSNLLDDQRLRYDLIKVKANNVKQHQHQDSTALFEASPKSEPWSDAVDEGEIDLELIRWKEQLNQEVST